MRFKYKSYTITFLEENIENLCYFCAGKYFLDIALEVQFIQEQIDILNFVKIKNFCYYKDYNKRMKTGQTGMKYKQIKCFIKNSYSEHAKNYKTQ